MTYERHLGSQRTGGVLHSNSADLTMIPNVRTTLSIVALVPLLASCTSAGLFNMSDDWCAAHMGASESRCPKQQERVADTNRERVTDSEVRQND
jgi:hypothetical protein